MCKALHRAGEVDKMLSEELAPPPEPQTIREEFGKLLRNGLKRGDRCAGWPGFSKDTTVRTAEHT
jgi:hypothetical protein